VKPYLPKACPRRRGFAALALALPLALAGSRLAAATLDARSLAYVPIRYSPGDEVLVQALVVPEEGETLAELRLGPGAGLPAQVEGSDPELRELSLAKTREGWLLRLRFVPWSPGSGSFPETRLKGFRLPALPFATLSLLGPEDRDPSPPRPQRDPPGMALFLYGIAGLLIVLVLGAAGAAVYLLPAARALAARRRAAQAFWRFDRSLEYLAAEAGSADPASYFAALIRVLRLYLAARVLPEAPALTAPELAALPDAAFPAPATRERAASLVARADRYRFGGEAPGGAAARAVLEAATEEARAIGAANEEVLLARV
jgi:hypothetical protein